MSTVEYFRAVNRARHVTAGVVWCRSARYLHDRRLRLSIARAMVIAHG